MLSEDDLQALLTRAREAGLLDVDARRLALLGVPAIVRDALPKASVPLAQLQSDLRVLNDWPTLSGRPPLIMRWLAQAVATTPPSAREALRSMLVFEGYGDLAAAVEVGAQRRLDALPGLGPRDDQTLIIYARADAGAARRLGAALRTRLAHHADRPDAGIDVSEIGCLQHGDRWATRARAALIDFECVVLCIGTHAPHGARGAPLLSQPRCRLIPVLLPHADPTTLPDWVRDRTRFDLPNDARRAGPWIDAITELIDRTPAPTPAPDWAACNPYRGLRAFEPEHVDAFHGRGADTARLVDRVRAGLAEQRRLHTLIGASGSGASSLARAGLVPALRRHGLGDGRDWSVLVLRDAEAPLQNLAYAVLDVIGADPEEPAATRMLTEPGALHALVAQEVGDERLLILVDQVEETLAQLHAARARGDTAYVDACQAFFANLVYATCASQGPITVVMTVRADHLHRLLALDVALNDAISGGQILLPAMRADALQVAIERPAHRLGRRFEPGVVCALVEQVRARPGRLPALQLVLERLWREAPGDLLDAATVRQMGPLDSAISTCVQACERRIARTHPDLPLHLPALFAHLVRLDDAAPDTRRRIAVHALSPPRSDKPLAPLAHALVDCGLLTRVGHGRYAEVELTHESLLDGWPALSTWREMQHAGLRYAHEIARAADAWQEAGQSDAALWRGARAQLLIEQQPKLPVASAQVPPFYTAVAQAQTRRRRALLASGAVVLALAIAAMKLFA